MNHNYEPVKQRFAFGVAAAIMSALTMGLMVVVPAIVESDAHDRGVTTSALKEWAVNVADTTTDLLAEPEAELVAVLCAKVRAGNVTRDAIQHDAHRRLQPVESRSFTTPQARRKTS